MLKTVFFTAKDLLIVLVIAVACGAVFGGVILPPQFPIVPFGQYQLGLFPLGFALYQHNTNGPYYSFSPFNDFYVTQNFRSPLLESTEFQSKSFTTNEKQPAWSQLPLVWKNIFLTAEPEYRIENTRHRTVYQAKIVGNTLTLERNTTLKTPQAISAGGVTVQFSENDLIFEPQTNKLFNKISETDAQYASTQYQLNLQLQQTPEDLTDPTQFTWIVESGEVVVLNPNKSGGFVIQAQPRQSILIHPNARLIEVVEQNSQPSNSQTIQVQIETFTDLKEVI